MRSNWWLLWWIIGDYFLEVKIYDIKSKLMGFIWPYLWTNYDQSIILLSFLATTSITTYTSRIAACLEQDPSCPPSLASTPEASLLLSTAQPALAHSDSWAPPLGSQDRSAGSSSGRLPSCSCAVSACSSPSSWPSRRSVSDLTVDSGCWASFRWPDWGLRGCVLSAYGGLYVWGQSRDLAMSNTSRRCLPAEAG